MLPVYDPLLLARLISFAYLPILLILGYFFFHSSWPIWVKRSIACFSLLGSLTMGLGEWMSARIHERNNEALYQDILAMKREVTFSSNDLILSKNGAEHFSNWFLGTKAALITSLNQRDFQDYARVFILNPIQGKLDFSHLKGLGTDDEQDRYQFMMSNIPPSKEARLIFSTPHLQLHQLNQVPENWKFDSNGNWDGYGPMP